MGIDLILLPLEGRPAQEPDDPGDWYYAETMLSLDRDSGLFGDIRQLQTEPLAGLDCYLCRDDKYEESHYGRITEDSYGTSLTTVTAGQLASLTLRTSGNWENRAIWAYLEHMPPERRIVLYWT